MHGAAARRGIGDLDQSVHPVATADLRGLTNGPEVRQSVETIVDVRRSTCGKDGPVASERAVNQVTIAAYAMSTVWRQPHRAVAPGHWFREVGLLGAPCAQPVMRMPTPKLKGVGCRSLTMVAPTNASRARCDQR